MNTTEELTEDERFYRSIPRQNGSYVRTSGYDRVVRIICECGHRSYWTVEALLNYQGGGLIECGNCDRWNANPLYWQTK